MEIILSLLIIVALVGIPVGLILAIIKKFKKKSAKKSLALAGISLVVFIVAVVIYPESAIKQQEVSEVQSTDTAYEEDKSDNKLTDYAKDIVLSKTYSHDTEGIVFNYPENWEILDPEFDNQVTELIDPENSSVGFTIFNNLTTNPFGTDTDDEESIKEAINEDNDQEFLKYEEISIYGIPAKCTTYRLSGESRDSIFKTYWYYSGSSTYEVLYFYSVSEADKYEPIFDAIMDSYEIYQGVSTEPEEEFSFVERDSSLYGRWRCYDGSVLELSDTGTVENINFRVWDDYTSNPDFITWEASNGRLTFDSKFNREYEWEVKKENRFGEDVDRLRLKKGSYTVNYYRMKNTTGEGLLGQWELESTAIGGDLILNIDGTGTYGKYDCTWTANGTNLWESVHQGSSYDYYVSGNTLQLFFSDGSKVFTKVGN